MWKRIEKGIVQEGKYSFRVRMMIAGSTTNQTFDTLNEARAFRDAQKAESKINPHAAAVHLSRARKARLNTAYTVADALDDYRKAYTSKKKGYSSEGNRLDRLSRLSISKKSMRSVGKSDITTLLTELKKGDGQSIKGVKQRQCTDSTVRRYWNLFHHIFEVARHADKIDNNPLDLIQPADRPKGGAERNRRLHDDEDGGEYQKMLDQLTGEARVAFVVLVETAMRRGDLLSLQIEHVRLNKNSAFLPDGKTGEARLVPLSDVAVAELQTIISNRKKEKVFTITGGALRYQWRKARKAIGADDLRIHDLRHEAASRLAQDKNLNIFELQAVTGHKTITMLRRYVNLNADALISKMNKKP